MKTILSSCVEMSPTKLGINKIFSDTRQTNKFMKKTPVHR